MSKDASRTVHAQQAMEITDLFSYKFGALRFGHVAPRRLKLQEPDGPSTAGGLQARQSLVLLTDADPPQTLMLGWVDSAARRSEVKAYSALKLLHKQRFQKPLDMEVEEFDRMIQELRGFLKIQKIEVVEIEAAAVPTPAVNRPPPAAAPAPSTDSSVVIGAFAAGLGLGLLIGYLVFAA